MPIATSADYYEVLGVSRKATSREIRRAYRALARQCHPDLNPADKLAAQKFREIQEAYEVLGDARKRKAYDYYGAGFGERVPSVVVERVKKPQARSAPREARRPVARDFQPIGFTRRPARFAGIPISRLGSLAFAAVFLIGTFVYFLLPDPGVKEFQRAREALRHAQSWKKESGLIGTGFTSGEFFEEVSCPASQHYTQRLRATVNGQPTEITIDTIIIGSDRYMYNDRAKNWVHDYVSGPGIANDCQKLSLGEDAGRLPPVGEWLAGAYAIKKEGVRMTSEGACREWKVRGPGGLYGQTSVDWVCVGIKDHLPKFQGEPGNPQETRYYDWNVPVNIQRPIPAP